MSALTRRWRVDASRPMALVTAFVALLMMMSIGGTMVQGDLSHLNETEIEAYLSRVNKPAVKSFVLEDGEVVDCVDIYKQPAFDHPLLKDHKITMMPSFIPKRNKSAASGRPIAYETTLTTVNCPEGTIPIRRTLRSDLVHVKSLDSYGRRQVPAYEMVERSGKLADSGSYIGAGGLLNAWEVPQVEYDEWSHADLEVSSYDQKSFVESGWLVNPSLYGDKKTRLYSYWTADGYHETGCYNLLCPGFVQVSSSFVLGMPLQPLSYYDGKQYYLETRIVRDESSEAWWMQVEYSPVGYWPAIMFGSERFPSAMRVKWMGSVLNTRKGWQHTTTDMGSGRMAGEGWGKAAFIMDPEVLTDRWGGYKDAPPGGEFADNVFCYGIEPKIMQSTTFFGGPGLGAPDCKNEDYF